KTPGAENIQGQAGWKGNFTTYSYAAGNAQAAQRCRLRSAVQASHQTPTGDAHALTLHDGLYPAAHGYVGYNATLTNDRHVNPHSTPEYWAQGYLSCTAKKAYCGSRDSLLHYGSPKSRDNYCDRH